MPFGAPVTLTPKKRGSGCAGCGCGLLLLIALLVALGFYEFRHSAAALTDTTATPIPPVAIDPGVYAASRQKITDFQQAIENNQPATLQLDSDEINTAIARDPSMAALRGKVFVKLQGDEATIHSTVPLDTLENVVLAERFADFTARLSIAFNPGDTSLKVDLRELSIKGQTIPADAYSTMNALINGVIASQLQANGQAHDFLARTQKIAIENGELIIETQ
jgi:hypothetical protein